MSGAAGGTRIKKEDLKDTIRDYRDNVLKPLGLDKSYTITGVRSRPEKDIFGDIDIVVSFPEGDKKELKQTLANSLEQVQQIPIIPKKNKKYFIHGNIVSTLYPIYGKEKEYVQIDNIVTTSKEEGKFTYKMLDLPAQEQVLAIGLVKAIFTELDKKQIENLFQKLNIPTDKTPNEGEEYDFNLNPSELSLRIVPIGKNDGEEIWKSNKFEDVKTLISALGIDIEKDKFDDIIPKIKKFKNRRSIDRLKGMFKRNIRVGDAEVGIEKGIKKQQALDTVAALEEKYNPLVISLIKPFLLENELNKTIAIFPGKFKPPHKDHLARINAAAGAADEVLVIIGPKPVDSFTAEQTLNLFNLFKSKRLIPNNVKFIISDLPSPVLKAYKEFENNPEQQYIAVFGKDDIERFKGISKLPNVKVNNFEEANIGNLSATDLRNAITNKDTQTIQSMLPDGITADEYIQTLNDKKEIQEIVTDTEIICDNCGWHWSIKDGGDDLYICHKCSYDNTPDVWDLKKGILSLTKYMVDNGLNIKPLPKIKFINNDEKNASDLLGKTAYYNPLDKSITLYTLNRHPKDILRSYSHEIIHHMQNCENRLNGINTTNTNEDGALPDIEREAYEKGNMILRNWEDNIKNTK